MEEPEKYKHADLTNSVENINQIRTRYAEKGKGWRTSYKGRSAMATLHKNLGPKWVIRLFKKLQLPVSIRQENAFEARQQASLQNKRKMATEEEKKKKAVQGQKRKQRGAGKNRRCTYKEGCSCKPRKKKDGQESTFSCMNGHCRNCFGTGEACNEHCTCVCCGNDNSENQKQLRRIYAKKKEKNKEKKKRKSSQQDSKVAKKRKTN